MFNICSTLFVEFMCLPETVRCVSPLCRLCCCSIGEKGCDALIAALRSNLSYLRELNLSRNNPGDSAMDLLSDLLKDPHCKLEKLQ